jgi:hypothetical protein
MRTEGKREAEHNVIGNGGKGSAAAIAAKAGLRAED